MKKKRITAFVMIIVMSFFGPVHAEEEAGQHTVPEELQNLYAQSAVLMDADSGRILFSKNGQEIRAMASTTKIMTCILALEYGKLDEPLTVSRHAAAQPKVHLGMGEGEHFYLRDLLYSLMLESHNDSAVAIAESIGGSVEGFADMMNAKAKELGCENTYFITPNGLDAQDETGVHSTTAEDLARIMKYCIRDSPQKDMFLEVTKTGSYSFTDVEGTRSFSCNNHNAFLSMMQGALSGKTGFTADAGYCYVGALKQDERTFIVALLACGWPNNKGYKWADTRALMNYGLQYYHYRDVWRQVDLPALKVTAGIPVGNQLFEEAQTGLELKTKQRQMPLLLSDKENVEVRVDLPETLSAPVTSGQEVGNIIYSREGELVAAIPIVATDTIAKEHFGWYMEQIAKWYLFGMED